MQEETNVEPVVNQQPLMASVSSTSKLTEQGAEGGGEPTEWEYEFSTCDRGRVMFVHLWDTSDLSACERLMQRPLTSADIIYNVETGNGFVTDGLMNNYTFRKKQSIKRSYTCPDLGDLKEAPRTKPTPNVMDILARL